MRYDGFQVGLVVIVAIITVIVLMLLSPMLILGGSAVLGILRGLI